MKLLCIGDIVGEPGLNAAASLVPRLKSDCGAGFVIANCENAAGGFGVTPAIARRLLSCGIDVLTSGNHIWSHKSIVNFIRGEKRLLRPANFPGGAPGGGRIIAEADSGCKIGVLNIAGRVFMEPLDCPFHAALQEVDSMRRETSVIVVDFHAEATSEKIALGWLLDGRVSAVIGTHTHVQTADEKILPNGTAYITDVGMTGPFDSVIGIDKQMFVNRFLSQIPSRPLVAQKDIRLNAVLIDIAESGSATSIKRIARQYDH